MLGESTPRTYTVLDEPWSLMQWGGHTGWCVGVSNGASADDSALVVWACASAAEVAQTLRRGESWEPFANAPGRNSDSGNQLWRLNPDQYLVNMDGTCIGVDGGRAVTAECGGKDPSPPTLRWRRQGSQLVADVNGSSACLAVGGSEPSDEGSMLLVTSPCAAGPASAWQLAPQPGSGGSATWAEWFAPYLDLVASPAVKAFCYIDWFWPAQSTSSSTRRQSCLARFLLVRAQLIAQ
jgi:hypothetical protein